MHKEKKGMLVVAVSLMAITGIIGYFWHKRSKSTDEFHSCSGESRRLCQIQKTCSGCPLSKP